MKIIMRAQTEKCGSYNPVTGCCKILGLPCDIEKADAGCESLKKSLRSTAQEQP